MRTFYLFEVKDSVLRNYRYNYEDLYLMLERVYNDKTEDIVICYDIFKSIVNPIKKDEYNDYIKRKNLKDENYICYNYNHSINDYYFDETTKMTINNSHIKIDTNKNVPSFFKDFRKYKNIFVCDFDNRDYFVLEEAIYSPLH